VSWADRIAYVCHDFEDAVHAGVVHADDLPPIVRERVGTTRGHQLSSFIEAVVHTVASTGVIGMDDHTAEALAAFRAFNHERIYLRPASVDQGRRVVDLLRALTDHLIRHPHLLPEGNGSADRAAPDLVVAAVTYVAGMTDRYACALASRELDWPIDALPRGIDLFG
jgi:dGTPase